MEKQLEKYILDHIDSEEEVLRELDNYTNLNVLKPRMLSGHLQGSLLRMVCNIIKPRAALEIGTFTGYSAICIARGLPGGGHLHTIEVNDELEGVIREFIRKAGVDKQVTLHVGNALSIINRLPTDFDMIFIDGDKREYPDYYRVAMGKLKPGGYILADNTLWGGKVHLAGIPDDDYTRGVMEFNKLVKDDNRVEKVILPIRDGLTLIRKK